MSNKLQSTLERLAKLKQGTTKKTEGKKYAKFWKPKNKEKSNIIFLKYASTQDPFGIYHQHANLFAEKGKTVPCKKLNKGEECVFCDFIAELKAESWKGNFPVWSPIEAKIRFYAPVVDLDDLESGVQYWGYGQSVQNQLENWLGNLEEDEKEFYNTEELQKVIISFDKDLPPNEMYKMDKKTLKGVSAEQITKWEAEVQELAEVTGNFYKSTEEEENILEKYLERSKKKMEDVKNESADEETEEKNTKKTGSKLDSLKGKKSDEE